MKIYEIEAGAKEKFIPSSTDPKNIFDKVLIDCSESIIAMKSAKKLIYRGMAESHYHMFKGRSRNNRLALDTRASVQEYFDNSLSKEGFTALRSNSIFCTSNLKIASSYGDPYLIFPINGFSFTWSPVISDLVDFNTEHDLFKVEQFEQFAKNKRLSDASEVVTKIMDYKNTDLAQAIQSGNEIMIHGEYYAFADWKYGGHLLAAIYR